MALQKRSKDVRIEEDIDFSTLIQNPAILKGLEKSGYARPSPIQLQAIPLGRLGVNMIAQAKSGTGKTVVFAIIALESVQLSLTCPQALIVAPTREIALQIQQVVQQLGQYMPNFNCEALIGGLSVGGDIQKLKRCQVVVGTPGRLMALLESKRLVTQSIKLLVMDEADKLMSDTFRQQIKYIYKSLAINKQTVAFSATFTDELLASLDEFVKEPQIVKLTQDLPTLEEVQQYYVDVRTKDKEEQHQCQRQQQQQQQVTEMAGQYLEKLQTYKKKFDATANLLSKVDFYQCMIFVNSFPRAAELATWLTEMGWRSGHICAGLSQEKRIKVMNDMRQFKLRVLVCSDLIARGIDIDRVNLVINIDYPRNTETYLHRVGRTGRYGTSGIAVNLIATDEDQQFLQSLLEQGVIIKPLPDQVTFSDYRKELNQDDQKVWHRHQDQRSDKKEKPLEFTNKKAKLADSRKDINIVRKNNRTINDDRKMASGESRQQIAKVRKKQSVQTKDNSMPSSASLQGNFRAHSSISSSGMHSSKPTKRAKEQSPLEQRHPHPLSAQIPPFISHISPAPAPAPALALARPHLPLRLPPLPHPPPPPPLVLHTNGVVRADLPPPFILPPQPLFPSRKRKTHWIPPDLYF